MSNQIIKLGIVGGGYVGSATALFESTNLQVRIYDIDPTKRRPAQTTLNDIINSDLIFICVPTPSSSDGSCNTSIVQAVVAQLMELNPELDQIIIRSTVPPGTSSSLGTHFMPEFLTEKNWRQDFINRDTWIFGLNADKNPNKIQKLCQDLIDTAHADGSIKSNTTAFVTTDEAECAKYVRNCFLTCKVSFFNEIAEYCSQTGLDYETIRLLTIEDSRIGESHTRVPGNNGKYGFGGTCFPKDLAAFISEFKSKGVSSDIMSAAHQRNQRDIQKNQ